MSEQMRGTTIIAVKKNGKLALAGDGQVTLGNTVMKSKARKVRRIYENKIIVGFAGATADAFTLFERFEDKVREFGGDITRASVELAKDWRTDRALRRLEALMIVGNKEKVLVISGTGDVIEPEEGVIAIGSGGNYAYAAALAYIETSDYTASEIARKSLEIASRICIYTNNEITVEELE
jgi:ATP-dependent HslUV protease, peptidase subunit HslV